MENNCAQTLTDAADCWSPFADIEAAPADPILGIKQKFLADTNPKKVDLSAGVYQDNNGQTLNLGVVLEAQKRLLTEEKQAAYLPIDGLATYNQQVQKLIFGEASSALKDGRIVTVQTLGGTGALRIGADFLKRYFAGSTLYISDPSWENHRAIFERAGFTVKTYPYYDPKTSGVAFDKLCAFLSKLESQSIVLLHACCHNPTGVDLSADRWQTVLQILKDRQLIPFLDFAYQGFKQGVDEDAAIVRQFADSGMSFLVASSFSKNFALYRRRVGALSIVTSGKPEAQKVLSQIKTDIRTNFSNPPVDGAAIVNLVLSDPELSKRWETEVATMRNRIHAMRIRFTQALDSLGVGSRFSQIVSQYGMFSYSGLTAEQVERLKAEFSIYAVSSGRICLATMTEKNVDYVAEAVAKVSA